MAIDKARLGSTSRLALTLFTIASLAGCAGIGTDITEDIPEQVIPGDATAHAAAVAAEEAGAGTPKATFETSIAAQDVSGIASLGLSSLTLTITGTSRPAGDTDCWDFARSGTIYVAPTAADSALPTVIVAEATGPGCTETLSFTPRPNVNLKDYVSGGFRVITEVQGVPPEDDVSFVGQAVLRANVL